jgi:hypothetical protein
MTPTLLGRIQTRILLLLALGIPIVVVLTPFLLYDWPAPLDRGDILGEAYQATFFTLFLVIFLGVVVWEPIYHLLQQFRWEKDWPTLFGLLTGINESILAWLIIQWWGPDVIVGVPAISFFFLFWVIWIAVFLVANGPMRVLFIRWRFRGGRII